jgi:filamentous hemagglutinin family protein
MFLLTWLTCRFQANANPTGGTVTQGSATFNSSGSHFTINQSSPSTFINWQSFNIGPGETTTFNQPSANSVAWNQINDANPSQILGNLNANGYVVLQNASGFYIGGQAVLNVHGLVMTTATTPAMNLSDGGPWSFNTPPPAAKIQNFGQINISGGGTAYLIAADIVNGGTINAPNGHIGLYDGETVLVSTSPNGLGLSAAVTLPQGSVDNEGKLTADGGSVVAQAQFVNQNGIIQANTAENVNGTIELLAGNSVTLGANSIISAQGGAQGVSSGGSVTIQAGGTYSDQAGSTINITGGAQGGNGGQVELSAPQMSAINTVIDGSAASGYRGGILTIDPANIWLDTANHAPAGYTYLNVNNYSGMSAINLQANSDITVNTLWTLANQNTASTLTLSSGGTITVNNSSGISAGQNWTVTLTAGSGLNLGSATVVSADNLNLNFPSIISADGNVNFQATRNITLNSLVALPDFGSAATLNLTAGKDIIINDGSGISAGQNWAVNLTASAGLNLGSATVISAYDLNLNFPSIISADGNVNFQAIDNITLNSLVTLPDFSSAATLNLTAGNDIIINDGSGISAGQNWTVNLTASAGLSLGSATVISANDLNLAFPSITSADGNVNFQAVDDITVNSLLSLPDFGSAAALILTAGNDIIINDGSGISAGQNWAVNLTAGTAFVPTVAQPTPASGNDGIYLNGGATVQTQNGDINLWAANEVQVGWAGAANSPGEINNGQGSINTFNGGSINVKTLYGDVNTGSNPNGYDYQNTAPYYYPDSLLGGISTAAGGNVTINAGGNVISYLPTDIHDAGSGAYGPNPGNVTITAGGNVYGHYVVANGVGTVTAGKNVGAAAGHPFALSLIDGGWSVNAPNGNIYLQEVRNPNGVFNGLSGAGKHLFNYSPDAYVDLAAGNGVYLTGQSLPRLTSVAVQVIYPSILDITAGAGGVTLENSVTLFPSLYQNLDVTTTGNFISTGPAAAPFQLLMSDSGKKQWLSSFSFGATDHGTLANEPVNTDPVIIDVSGNMEDLNLITTKATEITVGGNMINCGFSGQNLSANDITSINVAGQIFNTSAYSFVTLPQLIPGIPVADLLPGMVNSWDDIFTLAVDPTKIGNITVPAGTSLQQLATVALTGAGLFSVELKPGNLLSGQNPGFVYNPVTGQLGYGGNMSATVLAALTQPITVLQLANGIPVTYVGADGQTHFKTTTISWADTTSLKALAAASASDLSPSSPQTGYQIGGPGRFDVNADSISLGNAYGILSCGADSGPFNRYANLASVTPVGATLNVTITGSDGLTDPTQPPGPNNPYVPSLDMLTSAIASLGGGDVNVIDTGGAMDLGSQGLASQARPVAGFGILTTGGGNVNVTALGDVNIDGSRIGTYDGGNIFIESLQGNVNVGNGGNTLNSVTLTFVTPAGKAASFAEDTYGGGIQALTLQPPAKGEVYPPDAASVPGDIKVLAPQGNISSTLGGIIQEALDGSIAPGPSITLNAGTPNPPGDWTSKAPPLYLGNIDLGNSGVIGGTVNLAATGNIKGQIVSRQNSNVNAGQSFSGTLLAGGSASVSGGGTISGTIVGVGGASVSGQSVTASVLGQNVSVNGGASQSTLGSSAGATSSTQAAAQQASSQSQQQVAADTTEKDDRKGKKTQIRKVGHVTVILASAR